AFVQLGTMEDAEMLVKYYSMNPLIIKGRLIRLNICTKYKTLNVSHRQEDKDAQSQRSSRSDTARSSKSSSKGREEKKQDEKEDKDKSAGVGEGKEDKPGEKQEGEKEGVTSGDTDEEEPERTESGMEEEQEEKHQEEGMRVVNILGFRRGYNFLNEMLALAKPFGKVVKHLVLDLRPEVRAPVCI
ncbi:hypothetical protein XENOCAPTIV_014257, partial [Xenoophorus captivus]